MNDTKYRKQGMELDVIDMPSLVTKAPTVQTSEKKTPSEASVTLPSKTGPVKTERKSNTNKKEIVIIIGLVSILITAAICGGIFFLKPSLINHGNIPQDAEHVIDQFADTSKKLRRAISDIESKNILINSKPKVKYLLDSVRSIQRHISNYEIHRRDYIDTIEQFEPHLRQNGNEALIEIAKFYQREPDTRYFRDLKSYMTAMDKYLSYYYIKYDEIIDRQVPQIHSYEHLYMEYKHQLTQFTHATGLEKNAIDTILAKYPYTDDLFLYQEDTSIFSWIK